MAQPGASVLTISYPIRGEDALDPLETLVERAKAGDREAFAGLLQRFESKAIAIARGMGLGPEDAQDAAQDAFLKLFRYIGRFRSGSSFTNWFYRIVVHATYDHLKRVRRQAPRPSAVPGEAEEVADDSAPPEANAEARFTQRRILRVLGALAPKERAAFVLRELQGLDTAQVARAMGVTQVTVRRHTQNARRKIRERLERQFPELFRDD